MLKKIFYTASAVSLLALSLVLVPEKPEAAVARTPFTLTHSVKCEQGIPQIQLNWNNPNNASSFTVHRNPATGVSKSWASLVAGVSGVSHLDTRVSASQTYQYQIQALGGTESSRHTNVISVPVTPCAVVQAPAAPTISARPVITATAKCVSGAPQVDLSWTNPTNATNYIVHRNPNVRGAIAWGSVGTLTNRVFTDTKVTTGTYQYQVQAIGGQPSERYSSTQSIVVPTCTTPAPAPAPAPTPTPAPTQTPPPVAAKDIKWGAYSGWQDSTMLEFESRVGGNPDHMAAFTHWGNNNAFPTYMNKFTKDKGRTLIIFWEPSDHVVGGTVQPKFSADAILAGNWDAYIRSFAAEARAYGAPVILIPFSEMNGNWNSWSGTTNGNTPAKIVAAWRHIHNVFGDVPNVKFGWAPNAQSVPDTAANAIEKYYPGDAYVDIVGVDGFNFNDSDGWLSFDQVFKESLAIIEQYKKPIYIFSFASDEGPRKAEWITDALTVQMQKQPLIEGWVWFNQDKENNWLIWSDATALEAFKKAVQ